MSSPIRRLATLLVVCCSVLAACGRDDGRPAGASPAPVPVEQVRPLLSDVTRWDAASSAQRRAAADFVASKNTGFALVKLETFSCGGQTHEVAIYSHAATGLEFVLVPGGTFLMGSPAGENYRQSDEPQHPVTLTKPFLIARTECTQAAYEKVVGSNPSHFKGPTLPVEMVSWDDSKSFCAKAGLSLPSEAQWEYACRGGTATAYCSGEAETDLGDVGWYKSNSGSTTHAVGGKRANAFGLFDVHGNVWEWCEDWYDDYPSGAVTDPTGPAGSAHRVIRGGCWNFTDTFARSAIRTRLSPAFRTLSFGFRPARLVATE